MLTESNVFRSGWVLMCLFVIGLVLYSLIYFIPGMPYGIQPDVYRDTRHTLPLLLHIGGGMLAVLSGLFQFWGHFRNRFPRVHRMLGYVYLASVSTSSIAALNIVAVAQGGFSTQVAFSLLAIFWLFSTAMGYGKIVAKDWIKHRQWMIRSYAFALAFVSLRIWLGLFTALGVPFEQAYQSVAWLCWVPHIIVTQCYFDSALYKKRQRRIGIGMSPSMGQRAS